ncbi:SIS domain-containing protein [Streptococcus suis]|nr:SIS domain-containing protein [Streptococcus suis]
MYQLSKQELERLGAIITTTEIVQQPDLWEEAYGLYVDQLDKIEAFISGIRDKHGFVNVIFTGAGSSDFVGQSVSNYLNQVNDLKTVRFSAIGSTEIVCRPQDYLQEDVATILVSFARSGNSPESLAAVDVTRALVKDAYFVNITCAPEGQLAQASEGDEQTLLLLQPVLSNDKGFAMTGSFSCMSLTALFVFSPASLEQKSEWVRTIARLGRDVLGREEAVQSLVNLDFDRVIYLGAGGFYGLSHESQLKILELTAGQIATMYETPMGFRHGPKSLINEKTIVVAYTSNDAYTRQYDLDLINEVHGDKIAAGLIALGSQPLTETEAETFILSDGGADLPDAFLGFPYLVFAQTFAMLTALKCKNLPDTPSPTGTVNRVVKGVTIHPLP